MRRYHLVRGDTWDDRPLLATVDGEPLPLFSLGVLPEVLPEWTRDDLVLSLLAEHLEIPRALRDREHFKRQPSPAHRRARRLHLALAEVLLPPDLRDTRMTEEFLDRELLQALPECWAPGDTVWVRADGRWQAAWIYGVSNGWVRVSRVSDTDASYLPNLKRLRSELVHRVPALKGADRPDRLETLEPIP